jgi:LysR family transcriptional regulator for metE and metH
LTQAGEQLLQLAQQILPVISQTEKTLKAYAEGRQGILRIGVECYPCYEWLTSVIGDYLQAMPDVDIDIVNKFQFSGLEGLQNHHIDILVTPDKINRDGLVYQALESYQLVLLVAEDHDLSAREFISPEHLAPETLLTFPVPLQRLDILRLFLQPAGIQPLRHKEVESLDIMLQLTTLKRGVCAVPEWLADKKNHSLKLKKIRLGKKGMQQKLYIAMREADQQTGYIEQFIAVGRRIAYR